MANKWSRVVGRKSRAGQEVRLMDGSRDVWIIIKVFERETVQLAKIRNKDTGEERDEWTGWILFARDWVPRR